MGIKKTLSSRCCTLQYTQKVLTSYIFSPPVTYFPSQALILYSVIQVQLHKCEEILTKYDRCYPNLCNSLCPSDHYDGSPVIHNVYK